MKTLIATTAIILSATTAFAQTPNNYIGTDNNGVISERLGNDANTIITRDMATQSELNRVDQEDHRVVNATVNSDGVLVLHSQDMDGGSKRNLVTDAQITGQDGTDGQDAVAPLGSLSFSAAEASFYGDGIGFGLSDSNYGGLEGSIVIGFYLDNDWRVVAGVTTDFNDRHAVSVGVGVSW